MSTRWLVVSASFEQGLAVGYEQHDCRHLTHQLSMGDQLRVLNCGLQACKTIHKFSSC